MKLLEMLEKSILVCDGAIGTYLLSKGLASISYDSLNITNPDLIKGIHSAYVEAGANIIQTNTFGANRVKLAEFGLSDRAYEINYKGAVIAIESSTGAIVAGSIGPIKDFEPDISDEELEKMYSEQMQALANGGVDAFILETFSDFDEARLAIRVAKGYKLPIIAQMGFVENGMVKGKDVRIAAGLDADIIGVNCRGPYDILHSIGLLASATNKKLSAQSNAGPPRYERGRIVYSATPDYLADYAKKLADAGANIIGGCCGTTPVHIKRIADSIAGLAPKERSVLPRMEIKESRAVTEAARKTDLEKKLKNGFVVTVEVSPPRGLSTDNIFKDVDYLLNQGIDAINVPDNPAARMRMSASLFACMIKERFGFNNIILHYTCGNKNRLAIQSELLGLSRMGIELILALTGDPPKLGDNPDAKLVYDLNSIELIKGIKDMNSGYDFNGRRLDENTNFYIGAAFNQNRLEPQFSRLERKLEAGAGFVITQPVYETDLLERLHDKMKGFHVPVIIGILPLMGYNNALYLNDHVPGIKIPEDIMNRLKTGDKCVGIDNAREIIKSAKKTF